MRLAGNIEPEQLAEYHQAALLFALRSEWRARRAPDPPPPEPDKI